MDFIDRIPPRARLNTHSSAEDNTNVPRADPNPHRGAVDNMSAPGHLCSGDPSFVELRENARLTEMLGRDSGYVQKIVHLYAAFDAHVVAPAARSTQRLVRASHLDILTNCATVSHPCSWHSDRITPKEQLRLLFLLV